MDGRGQQRKTDNVRIKYSVNHIVVAIGTLLILKLYIFVNYKHDVVLFFFSAISVCKLNVSIFHSWCLHSHQQTIFFPRYPKRRSSEIKMSKIGRSAQIRSIILFFKAVRI